MRLFDASLNSISSDFVLLAPGTSRVPNTFQQARIDPVRYSSLLRQVQQLRGQIYLQDGAISPGQLTIDGRHHQSADYTGWHLLALDQHGDLCGCARYCHYSSFVGFQQLGVRHSAMARCPRWGSTLRAAVEAEMDAARLRHIGFAEVGGWAITEEKRFTMEALRIALATYGLAQLLGGAIGLTTATTRHHSSTILRRIGGRSLQFCNLDLPSYFDPQYRCQMEVLRFDASRPNPAYRDAIEQLRALLATVSVIAAVPDSPEVPRILDRPLPLPVPAPALGWTS